MRQSSQTRDSGFFNYNPFDGAQIHFFPLDRKADNPRVFILTPIHPFSADYDTDTGGKQAMACNGKVRVYCNDLRNVTVKVKGKTTQRYSIVYPGRKNKRRFASY